MMHFRKFVIFAAFLSSLLLPVSCGDGPKTEVRVEPSSEEDDKPKSGSIDPKERIQSAADSIALQPVGQLNDSTINDTTQLFSDSILFSEEIDLVEDGEEQIEPSELDSPDMTEQMTSEDFSEEFLSDDSEIAENRLISSQVVRVINPELRDSYDSLLVVIEERLTIHPDPVTDKVVLEKWKSPVNFKGYKFNMRKLMLFGVDVHYPVKVYYYMGEYYFSSGGELYNLEVFPDFSPFRAVPDTALSRYLSDFEN